MTRNRHGKHIPCVIVYEVPLTDDIPCSPDYQMLEARVMLIITPCLTLAASALTNQWQSYRGYLVTGQHLGCPKWPEMVLYICKGDKIRNMSASRRGLSIKFSGDWKEECSAILKGKCWLMDNFPSADYHHHDIEDHGWTESTNSELHILTRLF